ncbi:MAG: type II toxin-antitoxin system VapC family toxin [Chloroflexi bacterium]|nr:type II toxin-antitoxin system VapC family toxin [Chloroflexota bacterium]
MVRGRAYLDTTVPSAYLDERAPDRRRLTQRFWDERLPDLEVMVSSVVLLEIRDTPDATRRLKMEELIQGFQVLEFNEEADVLAQEYLRRGIFPQKYSSDANHLAIAVVNGVDYFVSWNYTHLVKVNTRREVNLVNALKGYKPIEIVAPPEL